jgi:hypothetical protein
VISQTLAVPVEQHDDGSEPRMYDLRIVYPERPAGVVEVTAAADRETTEFWNLVTGNVEGGGTPGSSVGGW